MLAASGVLQGVERGGGYLGLTREGAEEPLCIAILPSWGAFTFPGLAPGRYEIARFHSDVQRGKIPLTTVEIAAGRTTWVDLRGIERRVRIEGLVRDELGPVAGAVVEFYPHRIITDASGRFEADDDYARTSKVFFRVRTGALVSSFELPAMAPEDRVWSGELVLGAEELRVRTLDETSLPTAARLKLSLHPEEPLGGAGAIQVDALRIPPEGETMIEHLRPGWCLAEAGFPNEARAQAWIEIPSSEPLVLRAPPAGSLVVRVEDPRGKPLRGHLVSARIDLPGVDEESDENTVPLEQRSARTDENGEVRFVGLAAGRWTLFVEVTGRPFGGRSTRFETDVGAGEERTLAVAIEPEDS